jgi:predicted nucleotidyltransferase component of viral defense system
VTRSRPANLAASIRQRLLNLSVSRAEDPNLTLTRYALERLLYRLARSEYTGQFILKGAMLFAVWMESPHRPTRDLDLLGFGEASNERLTEIFQRLCDVDVEPDGLTFDARSVRVAEIREGQAYPGRRVKLVGLLGAARIPAQIDVGFGDVVTPKSMEIDYPTLLDLPAPRIRAYPPETVVAEKLQAMVTLGMQNSRMRDFYDLWIIARRFSFEGATLVAAVGATFKCRRTDVPNAVPTGLGEEFATDEHKMTQWKAFLTRSQLEGTEIELSQVINELQAFLMPVLDAAANARDFDRSWVNGGPWAAKR